MSPKLLADPNDFQAKAVQIVGRYTGIEVNVEQATAKQLKAPAFPIQKVPALECDDGVKLFDVNAILYYLADERLRGSSLSDKAQVVQWMSWAVSDLHNSVSQWLLPTLGSVESTKQSVERAKSETKKGLKLIDDYFKGNTFLVGERLSIADITVASVVLPVYVSLLDAKARAAYPNLTRYLDTLVNQPQFKSVLGEVKYCETAPVFTEKAAQPKEQSQQKKEVKKQEKKEKALDDAGDLDDDLPKEKEKDPWAVLPAGKFDMDDFKRFFSNNPEDQSIPYFWQKFDKENFSIWYCEYKFPKELTMVFMSCNLISGMFQRLEKMRKWAFGSMILFGEDHNSSISGIWVWRGQDLAFKLSPDWQVDYESYDWKKLDPDAPETKKIVEEYLRWEGEFGGKKFNQGKIFK